MVVFGVSVGLPVSSQVVLELVVSGVVVSLDEEPHPPHQPHPPPPHQFHQVLVLFALQEAVVPPFSPVQVRFRGQLPLTDEGVPVAQRLVVGTEDTVVPLTVQQVQLTYP